MISWPTHGMHFVNYRACIQANCQSFKAPSIKHRAWLLAGLRSTVKSHVGTDGEPMKVTLDRKFYALPLIKCAVRPNAKPIGTSPESRVVSIRARAAIPFARCRAACTAHGRAERPIAQQVAARKTSSVGTSPAHLPDRTEGTAMTRNLDTVGGTVHGRFTDRVG